MTNSLSGSPTLSPSLLRRFAALLYDSLLVITISIVYGLLYIGMAKLVFGVEADRPSGLLYQLGWLAWLFAFYTYFWRRGGQTTGMRAWRMQIVSTTADSGQQQKPDIKQCLIRFLLMLPGWLLFFTALLDKQQRLIHDIASNTRCILLPKGN